MESIIGDIVNNDLLFGKDKEQGIVGAYQLSDTQIRVFSRHGASVTHHDDTFFPYFFLSDSSLLEGFVPEENEKFWLVKLGGSNYYQFLSIFKSWRNYRGALDFLNNRRFGESADQGIQSPAVENSSHIYNKGDAVTQYFLQSGKTLFKGMIFDDLYRMQLDIETNYNPEKRDGAANGIGSDEIIIVSFCDNRGWEAVLHSKKSCERELLKAAVSLIGEKDPDVIEGHNIFSFDLPYLQRRCEKHGIPFSIGRNNLLPKTYPSSIRFAERSIDYTFYDIPGRHVIDTLFLVQSYDISKRSMQSYGLKAVAKHFGFASPDRTYVDYKDIAALWENNHAKLLAYALDDVRETRALSSLLSASNFYLSQMLPYTYAMTARIGQAAKIEVLLVREYLRLKHSIPRPTAGQQHSGGYTEVFLKGILGPIVYADVESLYPSIMLSYDICPKSDELKVFPGVLNDLKELRFKAKDRSLREKECGNKSLADNFDAMQSSFKIVINAMYGYLGFSGGIFNDFAEADRVTSTGQSIAKKMIVEFEARGCRVIEVDTDGILFIPPPGVIRETDERLLVSEVSALMPEGIKIGFDGRYRKMISYMKKNYALLSYEDVMILKGSSLTSRSGEKFGRDFVRKGFEKLLSEDIEGLHNLFTEYRNKILNHELDITEFTKTESLKSTVEQYAEDVKSGKRSKAITYEIAIKNGLRVTKGDRITYYISGTGAGSASYEKGKLSTEWKKEKPDENTHFYLKRLDEHCQKFLPFFKPQDFSMLFSDDTLFSFSAEGIELIRDIRHTESYNPGSDLAL
ncbi:DNA polymerase domain-containing protein [Chlorobium sp. KB01]|uniref:DNA polymerase domain-containing protein n=1 Tax=Chlorobium sp. KB01 TaxID=1917528 RepID=UPI000975E9FD|nr:DNA polymerase domain-containing protein [Chlorobium sp. KB01]